MSKHLSVVFLHVLKTDICSYNLVNDRLSRKGEYACEN
jgi:hypothetical protein